MVDSLALSFLAGAVAFNALPHLIQGITAQSYPTLLGRTTTCNSAAVNFIAAWAMLVVAGFVLGWADPSDHPEEAGGAAAAGAFAGGLFHSLGGADRVSRRFPESAPGGAEVAA